MITTGFFTADGKPVEQLADGSFLVGGNIEVNKYTPQGEQPNTGSLMGKVVQLPTEATNFLQEGQMLPDLTNEIKGFIAKYVEIDELSLGLVGVYVIFTWQYDHFNTLPYIRFLGDKASGKTRATEVVGSICYKPIKIAGAVGTAPIFRLIDMFKGTLIIDEAELSQKDMRTDIIKVLNAGYKNHNPVVRMRDSGKSGYVPEAFDTFCPKILNSRERFGDDALESRCLTIEMYEKTRYDIPVVLPQDFYEQAAKIRNKLLFYRLGLYHIYDNVAGIPLTTVGNPRIAEMLYPLKVISSGWTDIIERYEQKYRSYNQEEVIRNAINSYIEPFISVSGLAEDLGFNPVSFGKLLRKYGYKVVHGSKGNYIDKTNAVDSQEKK